MTSEFLVPLIVILIASQFAGCLSHRVNLPSVFGILVVGLLLGPSVFGLVKSTESPTELAQLGVLSLMFLAGLAIVPGVVLLFAWASEAAGGQQSKIKNQQA